MKHCKRFALKRFWVRSTTICIENPLKRWFWTSNWGKIVGLLKGLELKRWERGEAARSSGKLCFFGWTFWGRKWFFLQFQKIWFFKNVEYFEIFGKNQTFFFENVIFFLKIFKTFEKWFFLKFLKKSILRKFEEESGYFLELPCWGNFWDPEIFHVRKSVWPPFIWPRFGPKGGSYALI